MPKMIDFGSRLVLLESQPDFPVSDLTDGNAEMLSTFVLRHEAGVEELSRFHAGHQRSLSALLMKTDLFDGEALDAGEHRAFSRGFATFDYMSFLVRPRLYDGMAAIRQTQRRLTGPNYMAKFELEKRTDDWIDRRPNVFGVLSNESGRRHETMQQLRAHIIGAQIACELQLPLAA